MADPRFFAECRCSGPWHPCPAAATQEDGFCDWCRGHGAHHGGTCEDCPQGGYPCQTFVPEGAALDG